MIIITRIEPANMIAKPGLSQSSKFLIRIMALARFTRGRGLHLRVTCRPLVRSTPPASGVNKGQREHKGGFRAYPQKGGGAVFS